MNAYDQVLAWASERQHGALPQLRNVCEWVGRHSPVEVGGLDVIADLEALGHVEVRDGRWNVVPPMLSRLADGGGNGLMIGSRHAWLVNAMDDLDGRAEPDLRDLADHVLENIRIPQPGPSSWYFTTGPEAPLSALESLGVRVFEDVAGAQLREAARSGVPGELRIVRPGELNGMLSSEHSATSGRVEWLPVLRDGEPGFYRYLRNNQRVYARRTSDGWLEMDYRWAVWLAQTSSRPSAWFVPRERRLYLRATVRPPLPIERALVLRTGRLATREIVPEITGSGEPVLVYSNISSQFASQAAALLSKELEFK